MGFSRDGLGGVWVIDCNQGLLQFEEETCEQNVRCDGLSPGNGLSKGGERTPTVAIASRNQFQNIKSGLFLSFDVLHIIRREVSR